MIRDTYVQRHKRFEEQAGAVDRRLKLLSWLRLLSFVGAVALLLMGFPEPGKTALQIGALLGFSLFILLVWICARLADKHERLRDLARINQQALHRVDRDWTLLQPETVVSVRNAALARDLNLFGHMSLFRLLDPGMTPGGRQWLADWLQNPAAADTLRQRQLAVTELGPGLDFRQEFSMLGERVSRDNSGTEGFLRWAESTPWLHGRSRLWLWLARAGTLLTAVSIVAQLGGITERPWWLAFALANLLMYAFVVGRIQRTFSEISSRAEEFGSYAQMLRILGAKPVTAEALSALRDRLQVDGLAADLQFKRLQSWVGLAEIRRAPIFHLPLQALALTDIHVLAALETWQRRNGQAARAWLRALGEFEALCALAGLHHDNPDWTFPKILEQGPKTIEATKLGHPLLAADVRIVNDIEVGPPGTVLFITGSNMSGKSTLLRAIGLNVVLAQAGGPVCASSLHLPLLILGTSIQIEDSLEGGKSLFMAELLRLKTIIQITRDPPPSQPRTLLYLLDEILRGTNSTERHAAVQQVITHLLGSDAIGVVTSHDLSLIEAEPLKSSCRPIHFQETLQTDAGVLVMSFDYRVRPGVCVAGNALKLLQAVGLMPNADRTEIRLDVAGYDKA